jgi:propionyl-CoA synthetase
MLYIYTPLTWKTKEIVRDTGGYAVALKFSMKYIYNVKDETLGASDMVGQLGCFILYGPLLNRNTTIILKENP